MEGYAFTPETKNQIDIEICDKKNKIEKLKGEIKQLELKKSKQNTNYIGRIFLMKDLSYICVTGVSFDNRMYGILLEDLGNSVEIYGCVRFDPDNIDSEISKKEFQHIFKNDLRWDKLKEIME